MALKVIGVGLGRTATFSLKFALEELGFGPCYHMAEVMAQLRRSVPLWLSAAEGNADWQQIFEGFQSTTDYPASNYWRELCSFYPDAKIVLTLRDADSWFESVSETIFSDKHQAGMAGTPLGEMVHATIYKEFGDKIKDRDYMTTFYRERNQQVIETLPADRLLQFSPKEGWEPLCNFLDVPLPDLPFPRVNSRDELTAASQKRSNAPLGKDAIELNAREYLEHLKKLAFTPR